MLKRIKDNYTIDLLLERTNPLKDKYFKMTRNADESVARELQPNPDEKREIDRILQLPDFIMLKEEERALLYRFRYSLLKNGKALVKFLQSAPLDDEEAQKEAMRLFDQWSPTNFVDGVSLLSIKFCANHHYSEHLVNNKALQKLYSKIRGKAIKSLEQQSLDRIQQIMLQLV